MSLTCFLHVARFVSENRSENIARRKEVGHLATILQSKCFPFLQKMTQTSELVCYMFVLLLNILSGGKKSGKSD